jgi:hypothetical protein
MRKHVGILALIVDTTTAFRDFCARVDRGPSRTVSLRAATERAIRYGGGRV